MFWGKEFSFFDIYFLIIVLIFMVLTFPDLIYL